MSSAKSLAEVFLITRTTLNTLSGLDRMSVFGQPLARCALRDLG